MAAVGAGIWIGIALVADREVGWIAWGIGIGVGWAMAACGASGYGWAAAAGALALMASFAGRVAVMSVRLEAERRAIAAANDAEVFARMEAHAAQYLSLPGDRDRREFLRKHGYPIEREAMDELMSIVRSSLVDTLFDRLGALDVGYALLGVLSAFGLVIRGSRDPRIQGAGPGNDDSDRRELRSLS